VLNIVNLNLESNKTFEKNSGSGHARTLLKLSEGWDMQSQLEHALSYYGGKHLGSDAVMVKCPRHADKTASLKLWIKDDGRLGNHCFAGCAFQNVDAALVSDGIQEPFSPGHTASPLDRQQRDQRQTEALQQRAIDEREQAKKTLAAVNKIWGDTVHLNGTHTRTYLRVTRGISVKFPPLVIHHHPAMWHPEVLGLHHAMTCKVSEYDGGITGCHITYLNPESTKADLSPNRIMRGAIKGRGVWFGEVDDKLNIAEGVETSLSVLELTGVPTVAALSAGNMAALILPETVKHVTIAADHDATGFKAAQAAATKFIKQGIKTKITAPPNEFDDWNDVLQKKALEAVA